MDPNDPRKRLQALQQSNPSIRQQAAPRKVTLYSNDGPREVEVKEATSQQFRDFRPPAKVESNQPQKQTYRGINFGPEKKKTVFGIDVSPIMGRYGKTRSVTATGDFNSTEGDFLKQFDSVDEEARRVYVNDLQKQAQNDPTAARTLQALQNSGRFKGSFSDAVAGFNDRLLGGTARGILRGADFLTPGKNTFGMERLADQQENARQFTSAGKKGEVAGTVAKTAADIGGLVGGSAAVEAGASKIPGLVGLVDKLSKGGKISKAMAAIIKTVPGSLGGSAVSSLQTAGKGEDQNIVKDAGIGLVADVALGRLGPAFTALKDKKVIKSLINSKDESAIRAQIMKIVPEADEQAVKDAAKLIANEQDPSTIKAALESIQPKSGQVLSAVDEDLLKEGRVTNAIDNVPMGSLKLGSDTVGDIDPNQVAKYAQDIAEGKPIPPVIVQKGADGQTYVVDGKHRLEAMKALGIDNVPVTSQVDKTTKAVKDAQVSEPVTETQKAAQAVEDLPVVQGSSDIVADAAPAADNIGAEVAQNADAAVAAAPQRAEDIVPDADPDTKKAIQEVLDSLNSAEKNYDDVAKVRKAEKASRAAAAEEAYQAAGGGEAGMRAKLGALRGKYSESGFSPIEASEEAQSAILNDIASSNLRSFEKTNTQNAVRKIWGASDGKPTPSDIKYIRDYFGQEFGDAVEQAVKEAGTGWREKAGQLLGLPRSLMATGDLSGTLRQGGILATRFPKEAGVAFKEQVKYLASEEAFQKGMKEIADRPTFEAMKNSKLAVDAAQGLTGTEEQFVSNLAEKIPGFGRVVKGSDRAYSGFLAKLRADVFDSIVSTETKNLGRDLSEKELSDVARYINSASGRGDLGKYLEKHSATLSSTLFSPRLWKSRLDQLNPVYYAKLSGPARKYALQSAASFASTAATVLGLAAMAGATVELDPKSSDFAKIKVGNTRYDIMGGLQQNIVFAWRQITGEKKNTETGEIQSLTDGGFGGADRLSTATDMLQNKANPVLSAGARLLKGKDRGGNPVNIFSELLNLSTPLGLSGTIETVKDTGSVAKGIAMNIPNAFGVGVQTYGNTPTKDKGANGEFKGAITPDMITGTDGKPILDEKGKPVKVKFPEGATELEKKAMIDDKRNAALADQYRRTYSAEDQALLKLTDDQLEQYVSEGKISEEKYNELQDTQQVIKNISGVKVPKGVTSQESTDFYKTYNGLNKRQQKEYLDAPADEPSKVITALVNKKLPEGLQKLQATNKVAKAYAEHEKDLNTHNYTDLERNNKQKAFYTSVYKEQQPQEIQDIYKEGPSDDLKSFLKDGHISKKELDSAIKLDNELFAAGLAGLKFSKKFRTAYGYDTPSKPGEEGSGKPPKQQRAQLSALIPKIGPSAKLPQVSAVARTKKATSGAKIPKSGGQSKKISIKL